MTFANAMYVGSGLALVFFIASFFVLGAAKKLTSTKMSEEDAADLAFSGGDDSSDGASTTIYEKKVFKGKAWGTSFGATISTREVVDMVKQGRYKEAAPWLFAFLAAAMCFFFWPTAIALLCGAEAWIAVATGLFFLVFAVRAGWPQK